MVCRIPEMFKQIAVWASITTLLPLVVWYGTEALSPSPDQDEYYKKLRDIQDKINDEGRVITPTPAPAGSDPTFAQVRPSVVVGGTPESKELRDERNKLEDEHRDALKLFAKRMFWVAYPLGMVAFIVGMFLRVQAVGSGLMFGGIATLTTGCYSYWDQMDAKLKFFSLLLALACTIGLGLFRFSRLRVRQWTEAGVVVK